MSSDRKYYLYKNRLFCKYQHVILINMMLEDKNPTILIDLIMISGQVIINISCRLNVTVTVYSVAGDLKKFWNISLQPQAAKSWSFPRWRGRLCLHSPRDAFHGDFGEQVDKVYLFEITLFLFICLIIRINSEYNWLTMHPKSRL